MSKDKLTRGTFLCLSVKIMEFCERRKRRKIEMPKIPNEDIRKGCSI
jgi:hypothetical protein